MLQRCHGYAADLLSPCFGPLYSAAGVAVPSVDMTTKSLLQRWTWSTLNWTLPELNTLSYNAKSFLSLFYSFALLTFLLYILNLEYKINHIRIVL